MSAGSFQPRLAGGFADVYPVVEPEARSLASAIRASGVHVGAVDSPCVSTETLARARRQAAKLAELAERFLEATGGPIPPAGPE